MTNPDCPLCDLAFPDGGALFEHFETEHGVFEEVVDGNLGELIEESIRDAEG